MIVSICCDIKLAFATRNLQLASCTLPCPKNIGGGGGGGGGGRTWEEMVLGAKGLGYGGRNDKG